MILYAFTDGTLAPAPVPPTPAPMPMAPCDSFTLEGCFADSKTGRIMEESLLGADEMSAEVCADQRETSPVDERARFLQRYI